MLMKLKPQHLQNIAKKAISDEHVLGSLRSNVVENFGHIVTDSSSYDEIVEAANNAIDLREVTGHETRDIVQFDSDVLTSLAKNNDPNARRLCARVAPLPRLREMIFDRNVSVRCALAKRVDLVSLQEMVDRFNHDDQLNVIYKSRLDEASKQKKSDKKRKLGAAEPIELSDEWYRRQAQLFVADYGRTIEDSWEETAVISFCNAVKATSGVVVDPKKLLDAVVDELEERRERLYKRLEMKESVLPNVRRVKRTAIDPVVHLMNIDENMRSKYIDTAKKVFSIRRPMLTESAFSTSALVGTLPTNTLRRIDEQALTRLCNEWNSKQRLRGRYVTLDWAYDSSTQKIVFNLSKE